MIQPTEYYVGDRNSIPSYPISVPIDQYGDPVNPSEYQTALFRQQLALAIAPEYMRLNPKMTSEQWSTEIAWLARQIAYKLEEGI